MQVVLQADVVDEPQLLLQPVGVVDFGVFQLLGQDGTALVVLLGFIELLWILRR